MESIKKRIIVFGINFSPELTGIGKYTGEMVEWLSENGYSCNVITSFPYYPNWKIQKPYTGKFYKKEILHNTNITIYRCPLYVPVNPSGMKRILHEFTFFFSALAITFYMLFKPRNQYIFSIAPPFHLGFLALIYRFFKGGKIIYHIQDLQIEAAKDLKIVKSDFVFNILFALESYILKRVDFITSISGGMIEKIKNKTKRIIGLFPNWVDINLYFPLTERTTLKLKWGYSEIDKVVLYSGSIGEKQGLESLIEIALRFLDTTHIKFVICGNGPYKQKLEKLSQEKGAVNLAFLPLQANEIFNEFLNFADIHLVLQKKEASDLVMPSKLTTILSSGGLVIATAEEGTSLYLDIVLNNMGIVIPPENIEKLFEAINDACNKDFITERINARHYAEEFLNKEVILEKMKQTILI